MNNSKTIQATGKWSVKEISILAMLTAVSVVLMYLVRFPIFPPASFLEYDPADVPILIATLMFGTVPGLIITLLVCIIQGLTVSAQSGVIGILMHLIATGSMVLLVGLISKKNTVGVRNYIAVIAGAVAMVVVMIPLNLILTPIFMGVPVDAVAELLLPAIIPFNAIKAGVNSFFAVHIFIALHFALKSAKINIDK